MAWGFTGAYLLGLVSGQPKLAWKKKRTGVGEYALWTAMISVPRTTRTRPDVRMNLVPVKATGFVAERLAGFEIKQGDLITVRGELRGSVGGKSGGRSSLVVLVRDFCRVREAGWRKGKVLVDKTEYALMQHKLKKLGADWQVPADVLEEIQVAYDDADGVMRYDQVSLLDVLDYDEEETE